MNILVVGCGKVGSRLASTLSREGHDVSIVDRDENSFELLDPDYSGFTTAGIPIDQDVLRRAGIENCDAVAAISQDDNVNIMVSQLAQEIFHVPKVLARIYDPKREDVFSHFGISTVCPTNLTVASVRSALIEPSKTQSIRIGSHIISYMTAKVPHHLIGKYTSDLDFPENQTLHAIIHADLSISLYTGQKVLLQENDRLIIACVVD
jgi:trk system potassium uptake protein TrkA